MVYAMPRHVLAVLRKLGFYSITETFSKDVVISEYELRLSQLVLSNG